MRTFSILVCLGVAAAFPLWADPPSATSDEKTVVIGTIQLAPHSIEDPKVPSFSRDLFTEALSSQGWKVRLEFYPWARAFQAGKDGLVDAVWPSIWQKERETWFDFGRPVLNTNYILLKRKDFPFTLTRIEDLKPYRIGVLRGGITGSSLDNATDYHLEDNTSFDQNLQKLAAGHLDFMTSERYNGLHLLSHDYPQFASKVEPVFPPISTIAFYLMFSKKAVDSAAKREAFDRGLVALQKSGRLLALLKQYGYDPAAALVSPLP